MYDLVLCNVKDYEEYEGSRLLIIKLFYWRFLGLMYSISAPELDMVQIVNLCLKGL